MGKQYIKVYSREPVEGQYPNGLAYSVHMSVVEDGAERPLHNSYGLLFPKADIDERNVIVPRFVRSIRIAQKGARYIITGTDSLADGSENPAGIGMFHCWTTEDLISFEEHGLLTVGQINSLCGIPASDSDRTAGISCVSGADDGCAEAAMAENEWFRGSDTAEVSGELLKGAVTYWDPLTFSELKGDTVFYSDGSSHRKDIAHYPRLKFPLTRGFGDPVIFLWKDEYYFIATNDNVGDIGLYVRKAHEPDDLFRPDTKMYLILDKDEKRGLIQTFWAPEFHVIGGSLYILFAVSNENWGPQCHMMKLREGGDILNPDDWEDPVKIRRAGGRALGENGITLDMTYVRSGSRHYYVWSYREHIGSPLDSGSMIMVGEFIPEKPDELICEPVCLTRPLYGFENTRGTINNEGPYALYHDGKIYLAYSGGDARGYLYIVGMLMAEDGADLCDISSWEKAKTPVLHFASVPGELGPGHNSFFRDRNGDTWIAFHAVRSYEERVISVGIRRVHFDALNRPRFDLAWEEDLPESLR